MVKSRYNISCYPRNDKDKNGRPITYFEASWDKPRQYTDGKRQQVRATSRNSETEAIMRCEEKIERYLGEVRGDAVAGETRRTRRAAAPVNSLNPDPTVREFLDEWHQAQVDSDRWAPNSAINIKQIFDTYINEYLGDKKLSELTKKMVRIHFTKTLPNLKKKDKDGNDTDKRLLGDSRINYIFTNFRAAIRAADAKNWIDGDPTFQVHLAGRNEPAGTDEDIVRLMNAMLEVFRNEENDDPDTLRFALSFFTGMRTGERNGLSWSDIDDLDKKLPKITINKQLSYTSAKRGGDGHYLRPSTKTGRDRTFPATKRVGELLRKHYERVQEWKKSPDWAPREEFSDLVLLRPDGSFVALSKDTVLFRQWLKKHNISDEGIKPGSLRHASATWWASVNLKDRKFLQQVLGWSEKSDLDRYYTRVNQQQLENEMSAADDF